MNDNPANHTGDPAQSPATEWKASHVAGLLILLAFGIIVVWNAYHPEDVFYHDLDYEVIDRGDYLPLEDKSASGKTLHIGGPDTYYPRGIAVHTPTTLRLRFIPGNYTWFMAEIGLDAESENHTEGSVIFRVVGDGAILYQSPVITADTRPIQIFVPVKTVNTLTLETIPTADGNRGDDAIWAMPRFVYSF